jgi:diguanylate cyclase (GGDEF)-like protein
MTDQQLRLHKRARISSADGSCARSMVASRLQWPTVTSHSPPHPLSMSASASNRRSRPPLVLVANDQEWSARSIESVLGPRGYAALRVATSERTLELARIAQPDAIILDMALPDLGGRVVCERLRQDPLLPLNVPIICTTSAIASRSERLDAYAAGAWELCAEPLDAEVLLLKLDAFVQAKLASDRIREETLVDDETGLYNARGLARRAREIGSDAIRRSDAVACVVFSAEQESPSSDADSAQSDREIAEAVSRVCQANSRLSDAVGRLGPNEYAIIAPATSEEGAERIVTRLRDSFESSRISIKQQEHRLRLSASVAAVTNLAESSVDAMELLYRATTALRQTRGYAPHQSSAEKSEQR